MPVLNRRLPAGRLTRFGTRVVSPHADVETNEREAHILAGIVLIYGTARYSTPYSTAMTPHTTPQCRP
jgi:hypothetical protein